MSRGKSLNNCSIKKEVFFVLSRAWDKEKILSPHEESNLRPSDSAFRCSTTEPQRLHGERGLLRSSYDTRPASRILPSLLFLIVASFNQGSCEYFVRSCSWIRVLRLSSSSPVTFVVQRYYVHHEHVVAFGIQSGNFDSDGGKHAPCTENYNSN